MVFATIIFQNVDLGIERVLRCRAMELESLRCIESRLERVIMVRPKYALFSLETVSQRTFEHTHTHTHIYVSSFGQLIQRKLSLLN